MGGGGGRIELNQSPEEMSQMETAKKIVKELVTEEEVGCLVSLCKRVLFPLGTKYCAAHGGGKRCLTDGCTRLALRKAEHCRVHTV